MVDDVHKVSLHQGPPEMAYYPLSGDTFVADAPWPMRYMVRAPNAAVLAVLMQAAVRGLDSALPVIGVETLDTRVGRAGATRAFVMVLPLLLLLLLAAGLALLVGAVALYLVVSYAIAQRRGRSPSAWPSGRRRTTCAGWCSPKRVTWRWSV